MLSFAVLIDGGGLQFVGRPVGQREAVVMSQCLDLVVVVVDGFTTGLDVQPIGERKVQGMDAARRRGPGPRAPRRPSRQHEGPRPRTTRTTRRRRRPHVPGWPGPDEPWSCSPRGRQPRRHRWRPGTADGSAPGWAARRDGSACPVSGLGPQRTERPKAGVNRHPVHPLLPPFGPSPSGVHSGMSSQ